MAHMQGANAVIAKHHKSLERNELSKMLLRQLKLSNVSVTQSPSPIHQTNI